MGTINIKKSKAGKWNPAEVEKTFKGLKENLNKMELTNLTEMLIAEKYINQIGVDMVLGYLAKIEKKNE